MQTIHVENTYHVGSAASRRLGRHIARRRRLGLGVLAFAITASLATTADAGTTFQGTTFQGTTFQGTTFQGTTFQGTTFQGTTFQGTTFQGTTFQGTTFQGTTFQGTTFQGTTFQGTTFQGTSLRSARPPVSTLPKASTGAARRWPWQPMRCDRMHPVLTWSIAGSRCRTSRIPPAPDRISHKLRQ